MVTTRGAPCVLLDASAIVSFSQGGALYHLTVYLGDRAAITLDVHRELVGLSQRRFPDLVALDRLGWPSGEPRALPPDLLADAALLRKLESQPGAHEDANKGEISTALLAGRLRDNGVVVVIDDGLGRRLLMRRSISHLSAAQLALEMVIAGALEEEEGRAVYEQAAPRETRRFEQRLARLRADAA
jgi:hypothetical protein